MKTKLIITGLLTLAGSWCLKAQNASIDANNANISGGDCSAFGVDALLNNDATFGIDNTAAGYQALYTNELGVENTAIGAWALKDVDNSWHTAVGADALLHHVGGINNTAFGTKALPIVQQSSHNSAIGYEAGLNIDGGLQNTAMGFRAGPIHAANHNQTAIGAYAQTYQDDMVRIGDVNIIRFKGAPASFSSSDGRFKFNIVEDDVKGIDFIKRLRPGSYNMNTLKQTEFLTRKMPEERRARFLNRDFSASSSLLRTGFIAQEAEKAAIEAGFDFDAIHAPKNESGNYGLTYEEFVVPLVKCVQEQQQHIADYSRQLERQNSLLNALKSNGSRLPELEEYTGEGIELQVIKNHIPDHITLNCKVGVAGAGFALGIYDLSGKQVKHFNLTETTASIAVPGHDLPAGIYLCSILDNGILKASKTLLVE
jgi:trimeric autotransporter adhesin